MNLRTEENEGNRELMRGTVAEEFRGYSPVNERCPLKWSGVSPKVHQCWECWLAEVSQGYLCAPCYVAVKNVGFHRQGRQLRNRRHRVGSQHHERFHRRLSPVCAVQDETVQFAPEWARGPRDKAGSPRGWLVPHPVDQVWESIGSDGCNGRAGLQKVPFLLSEDIATPLKNPAAVWTETSVKIDPVREGLAVVGGLAWAEGANSYKRRRRQRKQDSYYPYPEGHAENVALEC